MLASVDRICSHMPCYTLHSTILSLIRTVISELMNQKLSHQLPLVSKTFTKNGGFSMLFVVG